MSGGAGGGGAGAQSVQRAVQRGVPVRGRAGALLLHTRPPQPRHPILLQDSAKHFVLMSICAEVWLCRV